MLKTPSYLIEAQELASKNLPILALLREIRARLYEYFDKIPEKKQAETILESRFTPSSDAFSTGMISCGSITNIATDMLRSIGFEVKKVHGSFLPQTPDHAWIRVKNTETGVWEDYDVTRQSCKIDERHVSMADCDEWSEITEIIQKAYMRDVSESK